MLIKTTVTETALNDEIIEIYKHDIGVLYFFENRVISEINEGEHVSIPKAKRLVEAINLFFDGNKSYGYISNRINDFSVSPLDFSNFKLFLKNINSYSRVTYNNYRNESMNLEKRFCKIPYKEFSSLIDASVWTKSQLQVKQNIIANI